MSTTAILVEILIVGLQACLWLALIILAFFGYDWVAPTAKAMKGWEPLLSIFFLGICYTIGVVFDRVADCVFIILKPHKILMKSNWIRKHAEVAHSDLRMEVLNSENKAVDFLENMRSRIRIARSTVLNSLLVTSSCFLFLILRTDYTSWKILTCILFLGGFVTLFALLILGILEVTFQKRLTQTHYAMNSKDKKPT